MKARKKPVIIDFFDYSNLDTNGLIQWVKELGMSFESNFYIEDNVLRVQTLEGTSYVVTEEDVVIMGISQEFYPCKRNIFLDTYDVLE